MNIRKQSLVLKWVVGLQFVALLCSAAQESTPKTAVPPTSESWPETTAEVANITENQVFIDQIPRIAIILKHLYPDSKTYVKIFPGTSVTGTTGTVIDGTERRYGAIYNSIQGQTPPSVPPTLVIFIDDLSKYTPKDGVYTLEVITETPLSRGPKRLLSITFEVDRVISSRGKLSTSNSPLSTSDPPLSPEENDKELDRLDIGTLAFNSIEQMELNETTMVELILSPKLGPLELRTKLASQKLPGKPVTAPVRVSGLMEAKLIGGPAFAIEEITTEEQLVTANEPTTWRWNVTAVASGSQKLHLTVNAILHSGDKERRRSLESFTRIIQVNVPKQNVPTTTQEQSLFERYWLHSVAGAFLFLVSSLGVFIRNKLRKRSASTYAPVRTSRLHSAVSLAPLSAPKVPDASIFISYSHRDKTAAFRIAETLRAAGCVVWLDDERLTCGDNFENDLEDAVRNICGFFVSIISKTTEACDEAYFHKERNWAAQRAAYMTHTRPFYFPVVIDGSPLPPKHEPVAFRQIDCARAVEGEVEDDFVMRIALLQKKLLGLRSPQG